MTDYIEAWQCVGCGKIEAPQTCIGICRDRKVILVGMDSHQEALDYIQRLYGELHQAQAILSKLALARPRDGQWEASWRALQDQARQVLASRAGAPGLIRPGKVGS